jgi:hypothetical protein
MDYLEIFLIMFLLFFAVAYILTGAFTTYFGAGKSRKIGAFILGIGLVLLGFVYYFVEMDDSIMPVCCGDFWVGFSGAMGFTLSMVAALVIVIMVTKVARGKDEKIEMSDIEREILEMEKELEGDDEPAKKEEAGKDADKEDGKEADKETDKESPGESKKTTDEESGEEDEEKPAGDSGKEGGD